MKSLSKHISESYPTREYKQPNKNDLEKLVEYVDKLQLECDGVSRIISYELTKAGIPHVCFVGSVDYKNDDIPYHLWVEVDNLIIDYRLRMWLGDDKKIPHGVFDQKQKVVKYSPIKTIVLDPKIGMVLKKTSW